MGARARRSWRASRPAAASRRARRAGWCARALARGSAGKRFFLYPRRGYGQLWEALAGAAADAGAEVLLDAEARRLELAPEGARVTLADGRALEARRVWSTLPVTALARMVEPAPPAEALAAAGALEYRAMALVYLVVPRPRYSPFDAHYLPGGATPVTRVSEPRNYRDGDDPEGVTVLCAEIPCAADGDLFAAPAEELGRVAVEGLVEAGLPRPEVAAVEAARLRHAYPVLRAGTGARLAALDGWAAEQPALLTLGRQALFVHDNAHHALAMAWAAADCLGRDGSFDDDAWARARGRFAGHVVED